MTDFESRTFRTCCENCVAISAMLLSDDNNKKLEVVNDTTRINYTGFYYYNCIYHVN